MSVSPVIDVATVAFDAPWAIEEQIRLVDAHLEDDHLLSVFDNSSDPDRASEIEQLCLETATRYMRIEPPGSTREHALGAAARDLRARGLPYCAFLDHHVFPRRRTRLVPLIEPAGFFGLPRQHPAGGPCYLWAGLACFSRSWLDGRTLGFRAAGEDADSGSMFGPVLDEPGWARMPRLEHTQRRLRETDGAGAPSRRIEFLGDWLRAPNGSGPEAVPDPDGDARLVRDLVAGL